MAINTGMGNYAGHSPDYNGVLKQGLTLSDHLRPMTDIMLKGAMELAVTVGTLVFGLQSTIGADPAAQSVVAGIQNEHIQQIGAAFAPVNNGGPAPEMGPKAPMQRARPSRVMSLG